MIISSTVYADETFDQIDTDQDGAISKAEAASVPALTDLWDTYDSNTDGKLDEAEFARFEIAVPKAGTK
ncbi:MAG TPA: EF-hand domain-containing protein [Gammaproteobacteria bacterium]|nr:EF-hand domain-containing protein [Gammaproteobacteria bacterium]